MPGQRSFANAIVRKLSRADFALIEPYLEDVDLDRETVLVEAGRPASHAYFLEEGVAALVTGAEDVRPNDHGIIGREGMCPSHLALDVDRSPFECIMRIEGYGNRISRTDLAKAVEASSTLRRVLTAFAQAQTVQISYTAAANAEYTAEARIARWLLMYRDRLDSDEIPLSHEVLGWMSGVRRQGVSNKVGELEQAGAIDRSGRGVIRVTDRRILERLAGSAYGAAEAEYSRLMR